MHRPQSDLHIDTFLCVCTKDPQPKHSGRVGCAHTRTRACTGHLPCGADPGPEHSPQRSRRALSQPAPKARSPPATWALPRPRGPAGLAGRFAVCPRPPEQRCRRPHVPQARGGPTGYREPADGPPGAPPRGDRGLLSAARASPWCVFPSSRVLCAGQSGGPCCGLQTPRALTSATCPGEPPARRAALRTLHSPGSARARHGQGVLSRAGFTKAGSQVVPFCLVVHDPPPLPSPLLCGGTTPASTLPS